MTTPLTIEPTELLRESARLRQLVQRLVRDEHAAEDATQVALQKSLTQRFEDLAHWRRWLNTTARNAALEVRRADLRRQSRESDVAQQEEAPAADADIQRIEAHRCVLAALGRLDPLPRSTLVRLYLQGRSAEELAREDGVSVDAIYKRTERALAQIRADLERRHGGRDGLMAVLAPLLIAPRRPFWFQLQSIARSPLAWAIAASVALLLTVIALHQNISTVAQVARAARPTNTALASGEPDAFRSNSSSRVALAEQEQIELRIVAEETGQPVPGASIRWWPLPGGANVRDEVETWIARSILEEQTQVGAVDLRANDAGAAQVQRGEHGFLATAHAGEAWGYSIVPRNARGPVKLALRWDADLDVIVLDREGSPVRGVTATLCSLGYMSSTAPLECYVTDRTDAGGRSTLKHAGHVKATQNDPGRASAVLAITVSGESQVKYLDLDNFERGPHVFVLGEPIGWIDVRVVEPLTKSLVPGPTWYRLHGYDHLALDGVGSIPILLGLSTSFDRFDLHALSDRSELPPLTQPGERVMVTLAARAIDTAIPCESVEGTLVDARGDPLSSMQIGLREVGDETPSRWARTDEHGHFEFPRSGPCGELASYELTLHDDFGELIAVCGGPFGVDAGRKTQLGKVAAPKAAPQIRGRVVDLNGAPLSSVELTLLGASISNFTSLAYLGYGDYSAATSSHDGTFQFSADHSKDGTPHKYTVLAKHPGYATATTIVPTGSTNVEIQLTPSRSVSGRVRLDPSLANNVWIEFSSFEEELGSCMSGTWSAAAPTLQRRRVDPSGEFELSGIGTNPTHLAIVYFGFESWQESYGTKLYRTSFTLTPRETRRQLDDIDLRDQFRRIRFVLKDRQGRPVRGEKVQVSGDDYSVSIATDSAGVAVMLVPQGARARVKSERYFSDVFEARDLVETLVIEERPVLDFELVGGRPALDDGFTLRLLVESLQDDEKFGAVVNEIGSASCRAPGRGPCRVTYRLVYERECEDFGSTIVNGYGASDREQFITAPSQREIATAVALLRARHERP